MINKYRNKLYDKYCIFFDTNKLPLDFEKWIKLDIDKNDLKYKYSIQNCLFLNEYYHVVIEAKENFIILFGNVYYTIEKGTKYIPFIPIYHELWIKITDNITIYIEPLIYEHVKIQKNKYNSHYNPKNELLELSNHFLCVYDNFNICDGDFVNCNIYICGGTSSIINKSNFTNIINVNDTELYLDLELNNLNNLICIFDKYIQYEYIKIVKHI